MLKVFNRRKQSCSKAPATSITDKEPVRKLSKRKHRNYCCINFGLNCCCGLGTKWERAFGRMTEERARKEYGYKQVEDNDENR
jgi:hypothetical protein